MVKHTVQTARNTATQAAKALDLAPAAPAPVPLPVYFGKPRDE